MANKTKRSLEDGYDAYNPAPFVENNPVFKYYVDNINPIYVDNNTGEVWQNNKSRGSVILPEVEVKGKNLKAIEAVRNIKQEKGLENPMIDPFLLALGTAKYSGDIIGDIVGELIGNGINKVISPGLKYATNKGKDLLANISDGRLYDPYTTFRGRLGYYGDNLGERLYNTASRNLELSGTVNMPELIRAEKHLDSVRQVLRPYTINDGRFPWGNFTTMHSVEKHRSGNWDGSDLIIFNPRDFKYDNYLDLSPSDTFILNKGNNFSPSNRTLISGNIDLLNEARSLGMETLSSPSLRKAYNKMIELNKKGNNIRFALFKTNDNPISNDYTRQLNKLLKRRGLPNYKDYLYQSSVTGLPIRVFRNIPKYSKDLGFGINEEGILTNVVKRNDLYYNNASPLEARLRNYFNIDKAGKNSKNIYLDNFRQFYRQNNYGK